MKFLYFFLIFSVSAFSSTPNLEGLFRNSSNKDISGNLVLLQMIIEKEEVVPVLNEGEDISKTTEEIDVHKLEKSHFFYKFLINHEEGKIGEFLQAEYKDSSFNVKQMTNLNVYRSPTKMLKDEQSIKRELFYSLIYMFALNQSDKISTFFSKYSTDYRSNKDMVNRDKTKLLNEYKKYLTAIKSDESLKEHLTSPLKAEDEESQKKIDEVMKQGFYKTSDQVKLAKRKNDFYWSVEFDGVQAKFDLEEHKLQEMKIKFKDLSLDVFAIDYLLFDGQHEMPQKILIKDADGIKYNVRIVSYKDILSRTKTFNERVADYKEYLEKNQKNLPETLNTEIEVKKTLDLTY